MKVAFFNHNPQSADIESVGTTISNIVAHGDFLRITNLQELENDQNVGVCIFHGWPANWQNTNLEQNGTLDRTPGLIVCSVSSSPLAGRVEWVQGQVGKHLLLNLPSLAAAGLADGSEADRKKQWKEFLDALKSMRSRLTGTADVTLLPKLERFLNPNPEAPLALRWLCEAYKLEPVGPSNAQRKKDINGIPVHCPEPKEWLQFFAAKPAANNNEKEKKRFEAEVHTFLNAFAHLTGDAKENGSKLANAIASEGRNLQNGKTLEDLVLAFAGIATRTNTECA